MLQVRVDPFVGRPALYVQDGRKHALHHCIASNDKEGPPAGECVSRQLSDKPSDENFEFVALTLLPSAAGALHSV